jgi:AmiR/NasT family two-component response regulator
VAIEILKELRGLKVAVIHPPDEDGVGLVDHLRRIGCAAEAQWPLPSSFAPGTDVALLAIDADNRSAVERLLKSHDARGPTLIAIVSYEDPRTLQMVIESGAQAVVERPVRPFGVLTSLILARSLWLKRAEAEKRIRQLERKIAGMQKTQKAKTILMTSQGLSEDEAYATIRRQAMTKRVPIEDMAASIINAYELLNGRLKND